MEYSKMKLKKDSMGYEFATNTIMKGKTKCSCIICHKPTFFIDVLSEANICSEECLDEFNKQYNEQLKSMDETREKMKKNEYTLSFVEVLDEIFKNKNSKIGYWYQGENFEDGYFLDLNENNMVCLYSFNEDSFDKYNWGTPILSQGLYTQKYRRVSTQPDVMRKI